MNENELPPWEQRPGESARTFAHFRVFLLLGPDRTVLGAYRRHRQDNGPGITGPINAAPQTWRENAREWEWHRRAIEWDREQSRLEEQRWAERRRKVQERAYTLHEALVTKAEAMLRFPLSRTITGDGGTIIEPARWTFDTLAKVAQTADALGRLACDMETVRIAHQVDALDEDELNEQAAAHLVALLREGKLPPEIVAQIERAVQVAQPRGEGETS